MYTIFYASSFLSLCGHDESPKYRSEKSIDLRSCDTWECLNNTLNHSQYINEETPLQECNALEALAYKVKYAQEKPTVEELLSHIRGLQKNDPENFHIQYILKNDSEEGRYCSPKTRRNGLICHIKLNDPDRHTPMPSQNITSCTTLEELADALSFNQKYPTCEEIIAQIHNIPAHTPADQARKTYILNMMENQNHNFPRNALLSLLHIALKTYDEPTKTHHNCHSFANCMAYIISFFKKEEKAEKPPHTSSIFQMAKSSRR